MELSSIPKVRATVGFAVLLGMVAIWRATADEDGQYCFAAALWCGRLLCAAIFQSTDSLRFRTTPGRSKPRGSPAQRP
jgi:hypothetical protein